MAYFETHGPLRRSQRKTVAALTWALIRNAYLGISAIGHRLAMTRTTTAKHAIKPLDRFIGIGNTSLDMEVACRDLLDALSPRGAAAHSDLRRICYVCQCLGR